MKKQSNGQCIELFAKIEFLFLSMLLLVACHNNFDDEQKVQENRLPHVYITTPDSVEIDSREVWVKGGNIRIIDADDNECLNVGADFRGRGNSTWTMPKKPYNIKLAEKNEVLGMSEHKRWVLLANWMDRTLLRNDVTFAIARQIFAWAPRGEFVELYINGEHRGNYYLCEQIRIDKNRVDIDEIKDSDNDVTGGYILEFDTHSPDEKNHFFTKYKNFPVEIKEPDDDVIYSHEHPAFVYIQDYINNIEETFENGTFEEVQKLIDVQSFADFWLINELVGNQEPKWPKSCYFYKKRNGLLYAGPVWDYDWGTFRPNKEVMGLTSTLWYGYLCEYDEFRVLLKKRWQELKPYFESVQHYIDKKADFIKASNEKNFAMWPTTFTVNEDESLSFDQAIARMRDVYLERFARIDSAFASY